MKTLVYSIAGLLLAFLSHAKEITQEQHAHVSFSVSAMNRLNLDAKNTETTIEIWGKDEISVDAYFYYRGEEDHPKIKEFMASFEKNVKSGITTAGQEVNISTYRAVPSKTKIGWASFGVDLAFSDDEAKVVYKIKAPASLTMNIKHSYKDLRIIGSINQIDIEQYSGRLSLDKVGYAKLNLKYGESSITNLGRADIYIYEQEMSGNEWGEIQLNAKYSKLQIKSLLKLRGEGYETKYRALNLQNLSGNYKYSSFDIKHVDEVSILCYETQLESTSIKSLKLTQSKYSSFKIDRLEKMTLIESYEDEYSLRDVNSVLATNSKYCRFNIKTLKEDFGLKNAYECRVDIAALLW